MFSWPALGTRVTVRYRRPAGSVPPLTDTVGHLLAIDPAVRVRTKTGSVVEFSPADVVAVRALTDAPVRTSEIRALEQAAAAAAPGAERAWVDGWLLRTGDETNYAVPLGVSAHAGAIPAIAAWYERRGLTPRLSIPDRLLPLPPGLSGEHIDQVLVRDVSAASAFERDASITLSGLPDVIDGELMVGTHPGGAVARAAVTDAPDGTRWVGLSVTHAADDHAATALCETLLDWAAGRGATRGYLVVPGAEAVAHSFSMAFAEALGFRAHHRRRYFPARSVSWDTV